MAALQKGERYFGLRFQDGPRAHGASFCPVRIELSARYPDMEAERGLATFRLPSQKETESPALLKKYVAASRLHEHKAHLALSTMLLASMRFETERRKAAGKPADPKLAAAIQSVTDRRAQTLQNGHSQASVRTQRLDLPAIGDNPPIPAESQRGAGSTGHTGSTGRSTGSGTSTGSTGRDSTGPRRRPPRTEEP